MSAAGLTHLTEAPAVALGLSAGVASVTYRPLRHVVTVIHESGHALVALLCGRRIHAIRLNPDSSGETVSVGRSEGLGVILTLVAGYPAPSLCGVAGVWASLSGYAHAWLLSFSLVIALVLFVLRSAFGAFVLAVTGAVLIALTRSVVAQAVGPVVLGFSSFLVVAGLRGVAELWGSSAKDDDASSLARLTGVAGLIWKISFLLVALLAFGLSILLLLNRFEQLSSLSALPN